jgi:acyl dehydratase
VDLLGQIQAISQRTPRVCKDKRTKNASAALPLAREGAINRAFEMERRRMDAIEFKDLPGLVGQEVGVSDWVQISQERVNQFAKATGDHQWIHIDVERATREIGGPIVHGYLTLSLLPFLSAGLMPVKGVTRGINYGSDKVRFISMVRVGKRVRLRQKLIGAEPKAGGMQIKNECTIEIEGEDRPACVAETISVLYGA